MSPAGLEQTSETSGKTEVFTTRGAESGALGTHFDELHPDLQGVFEAWETLPEPIQASILAMIQPAGVEEKA